MTITATTPRPIGKTGLSITALGFGTAPLGGLYADVPAAQAVEVIQAAWDAGIRYFDTAPMYGLTRAEHLVGQVLREHEGSFALSTKVGRLMTNQRAGRQLPPEPPKNPLDPGWWNGLPFREVFDYSYDAIMRSYDDSQQRLGMRKIDLLYVHDIGRVTHADLHDHHWGQLTKGGGFRALQELKAAGDIKGFGLGVNEWEAIRDALEETDLDCCMLAGAIRCSTAMRAKPSCRSPKSAMWRWRWAASTIPAFWPRPATGAASSTMPMPIRWLSPRSRRCAACAMPMTYRLPPPPSVSRCVIRP